MLFTSNEIQSLEPSRKQRNSYQGGREKINWDKYRSKIKGMTAKEIAAHVGCTINTVYNAEQNGEIKYQKEKNGHDWDMIAKFSHKYCRDELAEITGIPYPSICTAVRRKKIKCKPKRVRK